MVTVREDNRRLIRAALIHDNGEVLLVCRSTDKKIEETGIENRFGEGPDRIRQAPEKKRGTKRYDKVVEKIGQLKERNQRIARRYAITVVKNDHGVATTLIRQWKEEKHHPGVYVLRSNRTGLTEMRFFDIFSVLADIEDAFQGHKLGTGLTADLSSKAPRLGRPSLYYCSCLSHTPDHQVHPEKPKDLRRPPSLTPSRENHKDRSLKDIVLT